MEGCGSRRLRLLGQGLALSHPHEEAQRPQRAAGEASRQGECPREQTRAHTVSTPPRWRSNSERLEGFLKILPEDQRYAFEFRDPSWFDDKNYELLRNYGSSFCVYDLDGKTSPKEITADFAYVRLHGPDGPYRGRYGRERLAGWAGTFSAWLKEGLDVYCYFDNDEAGYAAQDALRLQQMM